MYPASFDYLRPGSLDEALSLLTQHGDDAKLLAGGHSLVPAMKLRLIQPKYLIDIGRVPDMRGIQVGGQEVVIGAMTIHADVADSADVEQHLPGLADAARRVGDVQVRNRGTIGGSVAHADPAADFPVILTALNASFSLVSPVGSRTVGVEDFFVDFFTTALEPNEVLTEIRVPIPGVGSGNAYAKFPHPASGYVVVSAGAVIGRDSSGNCTSARVAIGGLGGKPLRASATEAALTGQPLNAENIAAAAAKAAEGGDPEGDLYASAEYKAHVATVYAREAVQTAVQRAGG
ncbi:MAG TPA: xanthine dehydrogenase family protein subunit M [Chloroflexota bacterium]